MQSARPPHRHSPSRLVTCLCFVLVLVSENKSATVQFLDRLVSALRPGALLVVADSAGDFSQVSIGKGTDVTARKGLQAQSQQQQQQQQESAGEDGAAADGGAGAELEEEPDAATASADSSAPAAGASPAASAAASSDAPPKVRRRYWVYNLLDAIPALKPLVKENSLWYRYPGVELKLKYPLKFENMRYFLRIYQKTA
jgi:hypothetical protein